MTVDSKTDITTELLNAAHTVENEEICKQNQVSEEEIKAKVDFLKMQIEKRLNSFEERKAYNRNWAWRYKIISSMLGGIIATLLGMDIGAEFKAYAVNIAIVLGSTITIINAWEIFWDPRSLWIKYTATTNELRSLRSDLDYLLTKDISKIGEKEINSLYERYCLILEESNEAWHKYRAENKEKTKI